MGVGSGGGNTELVVLESGATNPLSGLSKPQSEQGFTPSDEPDGLGHWLDPTPSGQNPAALSVGR